MTNYFKLSLLFWLLTGSGYTLANDNIKLQHHTPESSRMSQPQQHDSNSIRKPKQIISGIDSESGKPFTIRVYTEDDCD